MRYQTEDLRIQSIREVSTPATVREELPLSEESARLVYETRQAVHDVLTGASDRLVVIAGPCSIHDPAAARDYAQRLFHMREALADDLVLIMRVYFEKPRTTVGWKGLINDPGLDESFQIDRGLRTARRLLLELAEAGVPAATEYLDIISPQYISDLVSWGAIGARTTESQVHRELASGLSCPVGFKNGTDGSIQIAIDAIRSASQPHHFLSLTKSGRSAIYITAGNPDCHIILRGGKDGPNFDATHVRRASEGLLKAGLEPRVMIDCSHANSRKQPARQVQVAHAVAEQIADGSEAIMGVMLESHLVEGRQDVVPDAPLTYGQSITDACIGWEATEPVLLELARAVRERRAAQRVRQQTG
ncbi:3-deoxy-7-phosphoheptulonate synthase [Acidihalobacter ferrooxydans]|uniref:Phospho-2-dehydro-3-deoxyheptonate aldolase n=1 Tax=Acidihalobacter ferrooxydans TaxID=1765967 RepID=A0A1P8UL20_9GAMM|nr:3-deoxy-7-phosphoheptulonate synthase [Acidihalobacter ferrooxydans]APZ44548.1 3-deoxy-7-phosphoheptulonate synthase [Acidihalobacter ferrooxydans]